MPSFDIVLMKEYKTIAAKYTFLPSAQVKKKALEKWKKSNPQNAMKSEKSGKKKPLSPTEMVTTCKASFNDTGKRKRSMKPLKVDIFPSPAPRKSLLKRGHGIKPNENHVSFNNNPEIRYRTESEASSASTSRKDYTVPGLDEFVFHSLQQNFKSYTKKGRNSILNKSNSEKGKQFEKLLNTNCSWSYKKMNTSKNESSSSSPNTNSTPPFIQNMKNNNSNDSENKRNVSEMDCNNENELLPRTKNGYEVGEDHINTTSFDGLLPKKNLSPKSKPQNKSNITRERKNLRSLKPINYANESNSSDEELVLQSRVYNRSKFDNSDEEEMENAKKKESVSKDASVDIKLDDSPPSYESSCLKDTDIPNLSANFLNQDFGMDTSRNENMGDESVSPNISFANEAKSKESFTLNNDTLKCDHSDEGEMEKSKLKDSVSKNASGDKKLYNSPPCIESSLLKDIDIPNSSDNSSNKDSHLNTLRDLFKDDESLSPNVVFTNETKSKESFRLKKDTSKMDHSDAEKMEKGMKRDNVSKNASNMKFGDLPPCNKSFQLKDTDNSSSQDSYLNILRNDNMDDESVSPNMFTNETKSKDNAKPEIKLLHTAEKVKKVSTCRNKTSSLNEITASFHDSKEKVKSTEDNFEKINISNKEDDSENYIEISTPTKRYGTQKDQVPIICDKEIYQDLDFNNSFFRTSFPGLSNDEAISEVIGDDLPVFDDSDASTGESSVKESREPLFNASENKKQFNASIEHLSNKNKKNPGLQEVINKGNKVKKIFPSKTPVKSKINSNPKGIINIESDDDVGKILSNKHQKKAYKGKKLSVNGLPNDIKDIHNAINLELQSLGNIDMIGSLSPSENPVKSKRNSNTKDTINIESDNDDAGKIPSKKHQKKAYKGKNLDVNGLPNDIKDIHDAISLELQSICNRSDMTGSLSEDDEFTRDFMDGKLDFKNFHDYYKNFDIQNNQPDKDFSMKHNSNSKILKEKELYVCLNKDWSITKQHRTQNNSFISTNKTNKTKEKKTICSNNLVNDGTMVNTSHFQELTGKRKQKETKCKTEKYVLRSRQENRTVTKPSPKTHASQELDNLNDLVCNSPYGNELKDSCSTKRNKSIQSNIEQKKELISKRRNSKISTEKSLNLGPSLSPAFLTKPVKRRKAAELIASKAENKTEESILKVKQKDEAGILDSKRKKPKRSWEDLEIELLPNANENKNISEESLNFLNDEDANVFSHYEKIKSPKAVEKQRNVNVSKGFSDHSKTVHRNELSRKERSPQIKYVFSISANKCNKGVTSHECKNKSTSLVPYASNASIIEKTIANMNRTTSPYLQQSREKHPPNGRHSNENYMGAFPVEFSYSIQQIKSTMYIKPSKKMQDISSQNEILNTKQKMSDKQNKITAPSPLEEKILPALTKTTPYKMLDVGMMPSRQNKLASKATQKQNVVISNKMSGKQKMFMNSRKTKRNERDIENTSNSSSEDEITHKRYLTIGDQLDAMKNYGLGKRKLHKNSEKSKKPKKEPSKEKNCRDEKERNIDLSEEEMAFHSGKQQKTRREMKQDHSKKTEKVVMNKEETNKKRNYDNFSSDSSEGYQTIELFKESMLQGNGQFSLLSNKGRTINSCPSTVNTKKTLTSKSTAAQKKLEKKKDVDDYQKYLKNMFVTEDILSQEPFSCGDKTKTGKQIEDSSDDVFSISTFETDDTNKEAPKGTGLLCDLFDK